MSKERDFSDPLKMYMSEVKRYPLLSKEEETELGEIIQGRIQGDREKAKKDHFLANLRLVVRLAGFYARKAGDYEIFPDLVQEGNLGLLKAVEKFDPRGGRISTYAYYKIIRCIEEALANGYGAMVRIPMNRLTDAKKLLRISIDLGKELKREAEMGEIAEKAGISLEAVEMLICRSEVSLDRNVGEDGKEASHYFPASEFDLEKELEERQFFEKVMDVLGESLKKREAYIIKERLRGKTLREIAEALGMTKQYVSMIELKAIKDSKEIISKKLGIDSIC
jgi:RNA polymerase primary sigma factor